MIVHGFASPWAVVATATPVVNTSTASLPTTAKSLIITGEGFDLNTANDRVTLSSGSATLNRADAYELV